MLIILISLATLAVLVLLVFGLHKYQLSVAQSNADKHNPLPPLDDIALNGNLPELSLDDELNDVAQEDSRSQSPSTTSRPLSFSLESDSKQNEVEEEVATAEAVLPSSDESANEVTTEQTFTQVSEDSTRRSEESRDSDPNRLSSVKKAPEVAVATTPEIDQAKTASTDGPSYTSPVSYAAPAAPAEAPAEPDEQTEPESGQDINTDLPVEDQDATFIDLPVENDTDNTGSSRPESSTGGPFEASRTDTGQALDEGGLSDITPTEAEQSVVDGEDQEYDYSEDEEGQSADNWQEQVTELKKQERLDEALEICRQELPLWSAYQQASLVHRAMLKQLIQDGGDIANELRTLYRLAAQASFLHDRVKGLPNLPIAQLKKLDLQEVEDLEMPYEKIGYNELRLIKKTDIKLLLENWGKPEAHIKPRELHAETWKSLIARRQTTLF